MSDNTTTSGHIESPDPPPAQQEPITSRRGYRLAVVIAGYVLLAATAWVIGGPPWATR